MDGDGGDLTDFGKKRKTDDSFPSRHKKFWVRKIGNKQRKNTFFDETICYVFREVPQSIFFEFFACCMETCRLIFLNETWKLQVAQHGQIL